MINKINKHKPINVIYVMGSGRSGSTLLSSMLGTQKNIISAGELYNYNNFFESADHLGRLCSCGEKLYECTFWTGVRRHICDKTGAELLDLKNIEPDIFSSNNYDVYNAIKDISKKNIIVDSSKRHYRLKLLLSSGLFRITIIHLIRDARAYSYSSLVTAREKGKSDMAFYMKLLEWQKKNIGIKAIYGSNPGYIQIRYEDLVADHIGQLSKVLRLCSETLDETRLFDPEASDSHEFSGNRRFITKGLDEIKLDTRYLENLSGAQWAVATSLVAPGLAMFGYPVIRRRAPV